MNLIDCSTVYHNASTRFTDGFEFGFGAEIGISTQNSMLVDQWGLQALTSYKYFCIWYRTNSFVMRLYYLIRAYYRYIQTPKGRYEWVSYVKALALFILICIIVIKGVTYIW